MSHATPAAPNSKPLTILIVDHTPVIVEALRRWVSQLESARVVGTVTGVNDAVTLAHKEHPRVVLYGLATLNQRGIEQLPKLRKALPDAFIIATSFEPNEESREPSLAAGANAYVSGFKIDTDLIPLIEHRTTP